MWFAGGVMGTMFTRFGWTTGVHILIPALSNAITMLHHPQPNEMAKVIHMSFGATMLLAALLRFTRRIPEWMVVGIVASFNFPIGTPNICLWAMGWSSPYGFLFLYFVFVLLYISLVFTLFVDPTRVAQWRTDVVLSSTLRSVDVTPTIPLSDKDLVDVELSVGEDERSMFSLGALRSDAKVQVVA
jgi:hypothetical protein